MSAMGLYSEHRNHPWVKHLRNALIALLFGLTGWRLPSPVESALSSIGSINTPMAMMVIGSSLAHSDIRAAFSTPRLYRVSLLRLIVMPLVFIGLALVVPINRMLAGICVIVAAMPIACGNTVAVPALATPCSASFHQL